MTERCPVCNEGNLHERCEILDATHRGMSGKIQMLFSICDTCGSEIADGPQSRFNKEEMIGFRRYIDDQLLEEKYNNS